MSDWTDNLRVHYDRPPVGTFDTTQLDPPPERSKYLTRRDADLDEIEAALREARDLIDDALEGFGMYADVQHRNLGVLVGQQIEQVIEFKRVKQ